MTDTYLGPEAKARRQIDKELEAAGWVVQDYDQMNLEAAPGVAVREFPLGVSDHADYMLFVHLTPVGVTEAKKEGSTLTGVEVQSAKYVAGLPQWLNAPIKPLPFAYESTGAETRFTTLLEPDARSRPVFSFHRPETLLGWIEQARKDQATASLRARLRQMPELNVGDMRPSQARAVRGLEKSLAEGRPRAVIQAATGSGKTIFAVNQAYRLIKYAGASRVLFLVDRANLGRQALHAFQQFNTPDDGRKFTELYNVQLLQSNQIDPAARVVITTVQRLYSILKGDPELPEELDEESLAALQLAAPVDVAYNAQIPIETFDFVVIDECHRSIYGLWRQVVEYFDAFLVGLTATPNSHTFGFFNQNVVSEYSHEEAVADDVNVDFDVYRIQTKITGQGGTVQTGTQIGRRNRQNRKTRWEQADEPVQYKAADLDRAVVAKDQIRTVIQTFRDKLFTEIFPGRAEVPKTLIFAKDDSHADDIVQIVREEFGKGNDFAVKITYRTTGTKPEDLLASFRNSYNPRIAVTVDMIATGTDVKPLECLLFMRMVKSRTLFEQMKGRGVRTINDTDFQAVTPDAKAKTRFVIVDAIGVTESELVDTVPLDKEPLVSLEKLLNQAAMGVKTAELASTLGSRFNRLSRTITGEDREELKKLSGGTDIWDIARELITASDPDRQLYVAQQETGQDDPPAEAIEEVATRLVSEALRPLRTNPTLRKRIVELKSSYEQVIDEENKDQVLFAGPSVEATSRAKVVASEFRRYIEEHHDEITALQVLYSRPYKQRLTFSDIKALANAISKPPHQWTNEVLWRVYEQLDKSKVKGSGPKTLTDIVSLVRFALDQDAVLVPYSEQVDARFENWLAQQDQHGRRFSDDQLVWLRLIRDHIAASLTISADDFELPPLNQHGGLGGAYKAFGKEFTTLLQELTEALAA